MKDTISNNTLINEGSKAGAVLGCVSIAYMFLTQIISSFTLSSGWAALLVNLGSLILWAVKFWLCIYLMRVFMIKLSQKYDGITNSHTFRFGLAVALFSSLLYSAVNFANVVLISPETFQQEMDMVLSQYSSILDSNSMGAMETVSQNFGTISFFTNLIYCFIFGTILSAILSRRIPAKDEFADFNNDTNTDEK